MKRITSICLVFFMVLGIFAGTAYAAAPEYTGEIDPDVSAMLIDADSGRVLLEQKADDQVKPASTTKILTTIIALENSSLSEKVTIPPEGDWSSKKGMGYSLLNTKKGEEITMKDLLYGMMLVSGDDAACAIAIHIGSKTDAQNPMTAFINMMNDKAQKIGMTSSAFKNPGGVEEDGHYVTARDMAKLAVYAMKNSDFRDIVKSFHYDMQATNKNQAQTIDNTNVLLDAENADYYQYATGIKTGSTKAAGGCLVASATKNDVNLIALIFNDQTQDRSARWKIAKGLFDWGFENYTTIDATSLIDAAEPVQVQIENYAAEDTGAGLLEFKKPDAGTVFVTLEKATAEGLLNGTDSLEATPTYNKEPLEAPIKKDDVLGTVTYTSKATGETVFTCDLIASRDVLEAGSSSSGTETAVTTLPPTAPPKNPGQGSGSVWYWLIVPVALIGFLVFRLVTTRRSKRYKKRRPHYSYRIK